MCSLYTINGISFDNSKTLNICDNFINLPVGFESYWLPCIENAMFVKTNSGSFLLFFG